MNPHAKLAPGGDLCRVQLLHGRDNFAYDSAASLFRGCHGVARADVGEGEKMIERCAILLG